MKSSSLGARLFEGLVQPILGSLWNSPAATIENTGDRSSNNNASKGKLTHLQRPVSREQYQQPDSSRVETPAATKSSVYQQRQGCCGSNITHVAVSHGGAAGCVKRSQSVTTRSAVSSRIRLANASETFGETHEISAGNTPPPSGERGLHKKPKRGLQGQIVSRFKEQSGGQGMIKGTNTAFSVTRVTRCGIRQHTNGDASSIGGKTGSASIPVVRSTQRLRQQKRDIQGNSAPTTTQASVRHCEKQDNYQHNKYAAGGGADTRTPATISKLSAKNVAYPLHPAACTAGDGAGPPFELGPLHASGDGGSGPHSCRTGGLLGPTHNNNSTGGSSSRRGSALRTGLRSYNKCITINDCSTSSSWGADECAYPLSGKSSLSPSESSEKINDSKRGGQAWVIVRPERSESQAPPKKQLRHRRRSKEAQVQKGPHEQDGALQFPDARTLEEEQQRESSPENRLFSCTSTVPSASVSVANSCCAAPSSCRLQCSDTTTTCSGGSMTTCEDSRDTATGSAVSAPEPHQGYLDVEEQMPMVFPTTPAEGPPPSTLCCSKKAAFPYAQSNASAKYSNLLESDSYASSFSYVDAAVQTSSSSSIIPSARLASAASLSATGDSIQQQENRGCGLTSSQLKLLSYVQEDQPSARSADTEVPNNIKVQNYHAVAADHTKRLEQHLQIRSHAADSGPPAALATVSHETGTASIGQASVHQDGSSQAHGTPVVAGDRADDNIHSDQQEDHQHKHAEGLAPPGSVIFGHRVLKPLRSKCLEENYDALVEIVAFTKRRCERETMELLRKDVHILYYARGLHHAAHVETYLRQQQNLQEKQQKQDTSGGLPHTDGTTAPQAAVSSSNSSGRPLQPSPASHTVAGSTEDARSTDNRKNPAAPCFPSVSAALAGGARPQAVPEWATPEALRDALERQQCYDPFSIFGEAPPELLLSEVYDEQHYTHISPQTRASHPVLARLKHQRTAALMAVFQQKRAALTRSQHRLEHEVRELQQLQQRCTTSSGGPVEHSNFPCSVLGRTLYSGTGTSIKTDVSAYDAGGLLSSLQPKKVESERGPEIGNDNDRETMLRLQRRELLVQLQLLERRLEEQLQQEERIHGEVLRNGFRFIGGKGSGAESGAALFRKWVLPALESWWQQQCQVELDWRNDPLTSEECGWYREVMNAVVDASDLISIQQACFCPTPPPYRQWTWTDCRVRQRQQHEQNLAKLRQQQLLLQQQQQAKLGDMGDSRRETEWIVEANEEHSDVERAAKASERGASEEGGEMVNTADRRDSYLQKNNLGVESPHGKHAIEVSEEQSYAVESAGGGGPLVREQDEHLLSGRSSRRGRKRRAKEGESTPQAYGFIVEAQGVDREIAAASNSGSARKRPRSFCRQVQHAHSTRSQNAQIFGECSSNEYGSSNQVLKKEALSKVPCRPTLAGKSGAFFQSHAPPPATTETSRSCDHPELVVRPDDGNAQLSWQQPACHLSGSEGNSGNAMEVRCNPLCGRRDGTGVVSPCRGRDDGHALSTPVAKLQALKLSKQQRSVSTVPMQQAQLRGKSTDRSQQAHLRNVLHVSSNKTAVLRQVSPSGEQSFVSPVAAPATTPKVRTCHLGNRWKGSSAPSVAVMRAAWDTQKPATADTLGALAAAAQSTWCSGGLRPDGGRNTIAARGASDASFSASATEALRSATKAGKQLKISAVQRRSRQLLKHESRSARTAQESCMPTYKPGRGVHTPSGTVAHSKGTAALTVGELTSGNYSPAEPVTGGIPHKGTRVSDNCTNKPPYLQSGCIARAAALRAARGGARLSIDRVYGCRRTSSYLLGKLNNRAQFVLESLAPPTTTTTTFPAGNGDESTLATDDGCKKDIECIHNGVL